ncbi:helix-turn-helix domain-containing protein [Shewanella woodyi]|uniref:helix-turn-helix domain-containing protein n=1 Tax=Shewanella woodyi TaxID=60961 RepID=UPI0007EC27CC|nr:AraC family transcriptional regulator [Shewanella woodyi]
MNKKTPKLSFKKELNLIGFEILSLEELYSRKAPSFLTRSKILQFHIVIFIVEGQGEHFIDFNAHDISKGSIIFIGKNQAHAWQKYRSCEGFAILFTDNFLYKNQVEFNALSYDYPFNPILYNQVISVSEQAQFESFKSLIRFISKEYALSSYATQQKVLQTLLRTLLLKVHCLLVKSDSTTKKQSKELFVRLQKILDQNIMHTKTANDYIALLGASYHQVNSVVKQYTNKSLKLFIDDTLILHAKRLLSNNNNISQSAIALGFDEATNFTKFFKKRTGQTPKEFKEFISK